MLRTWRKVSFFLLDLLHYNCCSFFLCTKMKVASSHLWLFDNFQLKWVGYLVSNFLAMLVETQIIFIWRDILVEYMGYGIPIMYWVMNFSPAIVKELVRIGVFFPWCSGVIKFLSSCLQGCLVGLTNYM